MSRSFARALDIPMVGKVPGMLTRVENGDPVLVDGDNGLVYVRPGDDVRSSFADAMAAAR